MLAQRRIEDLAGLRALLATCAHDISWEQPTGKGVLLALAAHAAAEGAREKVLFLVQERGAPVNFAAVCTLPDKPEEDKLWA